MGTGRTWPGQKAAGTHDRRTEPRLDKSFPVFVEGEGGVTLGVARNISVGGMFIEARNTEPLGSQVRITFASGGGEMTAVAEVRYVCHLMGRLSEVGSRTHAVRGMGVRFLYFEPGGDAPPVAH